MKYPGLDDAFLRYIQATPENQRRIQSFYIPFFVKLQGLVVDLACGHGDFVQLLTEHGVEALGVDGDPACCAEVRQRGVNIVCADVFDYLQQVEENSLAGICSFHLVEHLHYQQVMELIRLSYRALKPGGIILLATPNVRGLFPHLESFYMHFGHVTFYHPRLLSFFLDYWGFSEPRAGENPRMAQPLWRYVAWSDPDELPVPVDPELDTAGELGLPRSVHCDPTLPSRYRNVLGRLISAVKMFAVHLLVQPLLDRLAMQINENVYTLNRHIVHFNRTIAYQQNYLRRLNANVNATHQRLMGLDRGVECYVYATKGKTALDLPPELVGEKL